MAIATTIMRDTYVLKDGTSGTMTNMELFVKSISLEHSAAANAIVCNAAGDEFARLRIGAGLESDRVYYGECGKRVKGLSIPTSGKTSMANLYVELV
jgi:hypothetical protein